MKRISRVELVASCRENRTPAARPQTSLNRVHDQLSMVLDELLKDLDYRSNPSSAPAFFARCLAVIIGDIEDVIGPRLPSHPPLPPRIDRIGPKERPRSRADSSGRRSGRVRQARGADVQP